MSDRQKNGRFGKGNKCGGGLLAARASQLRMALLNAVGPGDITAIAIALATKAKKGDFNAAKLILSYCLGEPQAFDALQEVEELKRAYAKSQQTAGSDPAESDPESC